MPIFSARSKANLLTCHHDLQRLFNEVIKHVDCAVICGHRNMADQDKAVREGKSKVQWPNSKHNSLPSMAVDVVPLPVDWDNLAAFHALSAIVKECAARLDIPVTWGADWNNNGKTSDERFQDYPHWQLRQVPKAGI